MNRKRARELESLLTKVNARATALGRVQHVETLAFLENLPVERYILGNGLQVLLLVDRSAPVIAFQAWFRVGSRHERPGKTGLAHLFEHLMFNEVEGLPAGAFDQRMEAIGADNNASTWLDFTQYQEAFPREHLRVVIDLESRRMDQLVLREPQVKSEKEVVMNERRYRVEDDVEGASEELLYKASFTEHPYHAPTIGWMQDIEGLTSDDCRSFYQAYYAPNNATLVLVGDLDERKTLSLISEHYGRHAPSVLPAEDVRFDPPKLAETRLELIQPTATEKLLLAYPGPALGDADHAVCCLLLEVLVGGRSSRLMRRLVRQDQLASDVSGFVGPHRDPALIEFSASAQGAHVAEELLASIDQELTQLVDELISDVELERSKARMEFGHFAGMETAEGKASQLGFFEAVLGNPTEGLARFRRLQNVTPSEIRRVARRYLTHPGRTVLCVRSREGKAA